MYPEVNLSGFKIVERFAIWRYVFIVIVVNLIRCKMAESQHSIDNVEVAGKRALRSVIDDSVISERIVALKRSKAGHLSEITKIYRRLNEYFKDYKYSPEVRSEAHRLDVQWKQYSHVYYDLIQLLPDEGVGKKHAENRHAEHNKIYYGYIKSIDQYMIGSEEEVTKAVDDKGTVADGNFMELTQIASPNLPISELNDDVRSVLSGCSRRSSASKASAVAQEDAKLQKILSEKKLEQLKRAKERRLKEEQLRLDNQIAEAEDVVELAKTKVQFYEELEDAVPSPISRANSVLDIACEEKPKDVKTEHLNSEKLEDPMKPLEIMNHKSTLKDERSVLWTPLAEAPEPRGGPLFSSTPGEAALPKLHVKGSSLNPAAPPFVKAALLSNQGHQPDGVSSLANTTETMVTKLTASIDSIVTKSNLPPLDVVKFSGNPCEYFRFRARFDEMVGTQNISETEKMSRLLQFLDGQARSSVAGFEGVPGGLSRALKTLQQRFGQPHIVAKACVDALVDGPNISSNDGPGLQRFADRSRVLYETLKSMNALPEMNMTNLAKMSGKLPIALQVKWRDEALRIRESRGSPNLKDLVEFIERRAEASNDPVFGRVGEMSKSVPRKYPRGGRQTLPPVPNAAVDSKVMTMATQVGLSGSENPPTSNKDQTPTMQKGVGVKCYSCDSAHRIERCPDFIGKSVRQRMILARYKGLCLNCLRKGHFASQCQSSFRCKQCQQPHHSLLHKTTEEKEGGGVNLQGNSDPKEQANVNATTTEPIAPIETTTTHIP